MRSTRRHVLRSAGILGLAAGAGAVAPGLARAANPHVVFAEDFEGQDFSAWTRQRIDGNGTMSLVGSPVRSGRQAARFTVPDDGVSYRSEVAVEPWGWGTYRFRFSDFLPSDWAINDFGTIVAQWHGYPLSNGKDTRPPMSLLVKRDTWQLKVHWQVTPTTVDEQLYDLGPVTFGAWNDWDIRIAWSTPQTAGAVAVRRNGQLVARHEGLNNYLQSKPPYFKMGIYRASWNPAKGHSYPVGGPGIVIYDDAVRVTRFPGRV